MYVNRQSDLIAWVMGDKSPERFDSTDRRRNTGDAIVIESLMAVCGREETFKEERYFGEDESYSEEYR